MNKKESMTIEDFAKYADRVKRITEYKNNVNNELTQNEFQATLSAWTRIEDYAFSKPKALALASLKYGVPKSKISNVLREFPVVYTAYENTKNKMRDIFREIKITENNYQTKMDELEPIEISKNVTKNPNEITYKYPVIINKVLLKQKVERPIKKTTLDKFDQSISKTRLTNIFYGVVGSVTYLEAIEISRVMGLKFSDFVKEVLADGKQVEIADFIQKGLQQELSFDECKRMESQEVEPEEVVQEKPIDVEQIEMWQDIQESLNVGSLGVYEKRKLGNLIAMQIEKLIGNL